MVSIAMLIILAVFIAYLFLLKREIRSIKTQLHQKINKIEKPITISFVDKDITELSAAINEAMTCQREQRIEMIKQEQQLKEAILNISHDLRTPLTAVIGYLQLLNKSELQSEQREFALTALSKSKDLQNLIGNFYDISILETQHSIPDLKSICLDNILTDSILACTEQFEQKAMTPSVAFLNAPAFVIADEIMLKRVINNIIANAVNYGTGMLKITMTEREGLSVCFQNGIEDGQIIDSARLFDKFYLSDSSRSQTGTGLGLYIVKLLMEKMNGTVGAAFNNNELCITLTFHLCGLD